MWHFCGIEYLLGNKKIGCKITRKKKEQRGKSRAKKGKKCENTNCVKITYGKKNDVENHTWKLNHVKLCGKTPKLCEKSQLGKKEYATCKITWKKK